MKAVAVEGWPVRRAFDELRDSLIAEGKKFDEASLRLVFYEQLHLCCIGNAGAAACNSKLVKAEKESRRERFLSMEPDEFKACEIFLRRQGMYDDVVYATSAQAAPAWDDLSERQKVWAKLNCVYNHVDDPRQRVEDAISLLRSCSSSCLPPDVCWHYIARLRGLNPKSLTADQYRASIAEIADNIRAFLPEAELSVCRKEEIRDFQCTSDCFKVF
jgi:hypothetical protein